MAKEKVTTCATDLKVYQWWIVIVPFLSAVIALYHHFSFYISNYFSLLTVFLNIKGLGKLNGGRSLNWSTACWNLCHLGLAGSELTMTSSDLAASRV